MQVSLNLGTINITDMEIATFIQNKSVDEIKALFVYCKPFKKSN